MIIKENNKFYLFRNRQLIKNQINQKIKNHKKEALFKNFKKN